MDFSNNTQVFIHYTYKGIQYYIVSRDDKIYAVCYDNKKIRMIFKEYEKDIALKVCSRFIVDEEVAVKVDTAVVNNNEYTVFYDPKHQNYYWKNNVLELKNNSIDNTILNMKYNNQSVIQYSKKDNSKDKESNTFFKKVILLASTGTIIVAFALSTLSLNSFPHSINISYEENGKICFNQDFFDLTDEEKSKEYKEVYLNQKGIQAEFDLKTLENALDKNENLSDEEKSFLEYFYDILDEHKEYIDFNLLAIRLNTLKLIYSGIDMSIISGEYDVEKNSIDFYNYDGNSVSNFDNVDKLTGIHEIGHTFTTGLSEIIHECSNEAWSRATLDKFYSQNKVPTGSYSKDEDGRYKLQGGGYEGFIPFYYMLTQFMTHEEILKYQYSCDLSIIAEALIRTEKTYGNNYTDNKAEERAYSLLSKLDSKFENFNQKIYSSSTVSEALKQIDYYYRIKNGKSLYDDLNMFLLSDNMPFYNQSLQQNDYDFYAKCDIENRRIIFAQLVKDELVKNGAINVEDEIAVSFYLVSHPDIFFKGSDRNNMIIYINDVTINNNEKKQVSLEFEITPEICRKYEMLCNEKTDDIER